MKFKTVAESEEVKTSKETVVEEQTPVKEEKKVDDYKSLTSILGQLEIVSCKLACLKDSIFEYLTSHKDMSNNEEHD